MRTCNAACRKATQHFYRISYKIFMLLGMPLMIESVIISMIYFWLRYYVLKI
jgi:hypothetical protein